MMQRKVLLSLLVGLTLLGLPALGQETTFRVVVHPDNPATALPASQIAKLLLKQVTSWSHGAKVAPIDQSEVAAARVGFSNQVLKRTVAAVESYWQQQIYSGRSVPPVKVGSDAEVVAFVKSNPGAIGYVSTRADTTGVKVVAIND